MTPKEKIKYIKDRINGLAEISPTRSFHFDLTPVVDLEATGGIPDEAPIILSRAEQWSIIQKLEEEKFIQNVQLDSDKRGAWFEIFARIENKQEHPLIREQTLEHIARVLGEQGSGPEVIRWLQNWGVPRQLIEYPNTKWVMIFTILTNYSYSTKKEDHDILLKIISEILHPLRYNGDKKVAQSIANDFNKYLEYDDIIAMYSNDDKKFYVYKEGEDGVDRDDVEYALNEDIIHQEYSELEFLRLPENKEKIATLREAYRAFMDLVWLFCKNPSTPTTELNNAYVECKGLITSTVSKLDLYNSNKIYRLATYSLPFITLFSAEKYYQQNCAILSWDAIRPEMNATYSDIEEIYRKAHDSNVPSESGAQEIVQEISSLVAKDQEQDRKLVAERRSEKIAEPERTIKMEIVKMPELQVKNVEENTLAKGTKRIHLPKFLSTDWSKTSIQFLDERNVILTAGNKQTPADYASLGFANEKNGKPNTAWCFLLELAKNGGETPPLELPIPNAIKQHKMRLSSFFKQLFKNETEPFEDSTTTRTYKLKITLIPPQTEDKRVDSLGVDEYLEETMISKYEPEEHSE